MKLPYRSVCSADSGAPQRDAQLNRTSVAPGVHVAPPSNGGVNPSFCICDILPIPDAAKAICRQLLC